VATYQSLLSPEGRYLEEVILPNQPERHFSDNAVIGTSDGTTDFVDFILNGTLTQPLNPLSGQPFEIRCVQSDS